MRVKICGIRNIDEAFLCVRAGAGALGFIVGVVHRTEDEITPARAASIISALPPFVCKVMVTHLEDAEKIVPVLKTTGADTIQLHSGIIAEEIRKIRKSVPWVKVIKAVHGNVDGVVQVAGYFAALHCVDAILVDTKIGDRVGGTGITHDWIITRTLSEGLDKPIILAGGLKPENVEDAVRTARPFAVDVNSGVEDEKGNKDFRRLEAFISRCVAS